MKAVVAAAVAPLTKLRLCMDSSGYFFRLSAVRNLVRQFYIAGSRLSRPEESRRSPGGAKRNPGKPVSLAMPLHSGAAFHFVAASRLARVSLDCASLHPGYGPGDGLSAYASRYAGSAEAISSGSRPFASA